MPLQDSSWKGILKRRMVSNQDQNHSPYPDVGDPLVEVAYIHPSKQGMDFDADPTFGRPYGVIPVGIAGLVNQLRGQGIAVRGVVHPLEKQLGSGFSLLNWLKRFPALKIVLIDMHWYEHCFGAVDTAGYVKRTFPHLKVVLGGLSASGFADEILRFTDAVDFIIRGDAEKPLQMLVEWLLGRQAGNENTPETIPNLSYRADGTVVHNPVLYTATPDDLDCLDFVHLDFLEHSREYFIHEYIVTDIAEARRMLNESTPNLGKWITTARGCRFNCSYCGGSRKAHKMLAGRVGLVSRSAEKVVDELEELRRMDVVQASMAYDIAEMGDDYWQAIFTGIRTRDIKIGIYNEFFQMPSASFIHAMADAVDMAHSPVAISPLSGNVRVRRLNGKHYDNEALFDMLDTLAERDFYIIVYFSLNLPGETEETFQETLDLAKSVYEFYPPSRLKILNTVHTIDPLSPMNVAPQKYGITSQLKTFADYYEYCRTTGIARPEARSGGSRGYGPSGENAPDLQRLADAWDNARKGREKSWWPIPPGW